MPLRLHGVRLTLISLLCERPGYSKGSQSELKLGVSSQIRVGVILEAIP
jgi:hypothetical protein